MQRVFGIIFFCILFSYTSLNVWAKEPAQESAPVVQGEPTGLEILWRQYRQKEITREEYIERAKLVMRGKRKQEKQASPERNPTKREAV